MKKHPEGADEKTSGKKGFSLKKNAKKETKEEPSAAPTNVTVDSDDKHAVHAPFNGTVKPVSECKDGVFASKAMGDGIVITPEDGSLYSPVDGEIMLIFPTKHAIGLKSDDGTELLIHVGMDTVNLEGKPFTTMVNQGDKIKAGQLLLKVDLKAIQDAGLSIETPVVVTNAKPFTMVKEGPVKAGETVVTISE